MNHKKFYLNVCFFSLLLIVLSSNVFADAKIFSTGNPYWKVLRLEGKDDLKYEVLFEPSGKENVNIKYVLLNEMSGLDKDLFDKDNVKIKTLKGKLENTKYGNRTVYTHKVKTKKNKVNKTFLKLDPVVVFQQDKLISYTYNYTIEENSSVQWLETNITLLKDISNNGTNYTTISDVFVYSQGKDYKFGANDSSHNSTAKYAYSIKSDNVIRSENYLVWFEGHGQTHTFDFSDVCDKNLSFYGTSPNCVFDYEQHYENVTDGFGNVSQVLVTDGLKIYFVSDNIIDPTITVNQSNFYSNSMLINTSSHANMTFLKINNNVPFNNTFVYLPFDKYDLNGNNVS